MKTAGIIAEYNPFHTGHKYQINYIKETLHADYIIVAMSGDYVQRGTPALLPKHVRAQTALQCGADLVLELPVSISTASAEHFAAGSVSLLDGLGAVQELCFGVEEDAPQALDAIAELLCREPPAYRDFLKAELKNGLSYPSARCRAVLQYFKEQGTADLSLVQSLLSSPNNILGIEYCKALKKRNSSILPRTLLRRGSSYHESRISSEDHPSATALRTALEESGLQENRLKDPCYELLKAWIQRGCYLSAKDFDLLYHFRLLEETKEHLCTYADMPAALANRIINNRNAFSSAELFCQQLKTKELTHSGIRRALLHMLLGIRRIPASVPYARVLGFRKESTPLLREIKRNGSIPLITKLSDASGFLEPQDMAILEETVRASNIYESVLQNKTGKPFLHEYKKEVILV